ncbi:centromere protein J isoform X2 [Solea solea]|uniref:centromere protein J isoform X2 n=1 Tax=Solea solea TaxID=90069 RepID=UPI00272AB872|nr:centromere protein J isoform X2 [Solea solea]
MSSPDGLHYSQAEFLARWMPSSNRAGVILSPSTDLVASMRHVSSAGSSSSSPAKPDDSFSSDFAPLPASADSSCLAVDGFAAHSSGGERAGSDSPAAALCPASGSTPAHMDSLDEMAGSSQDASLMMKLEQLRKWQQHMQEQLKAHQLEELLLLQEEQQRLLGMMNGSEDCTADDSECFVLSPATRREGPPRSQTHMEEDNDHEDTWNSADHEDVFQEHDDTLVSSYSDNMTEDRGRKEDAVLQDRPIKPGIGGHKQTFEELLEEQLRLEEQRLKSARQQQSRDVTAAAVQAPPRRPFLKRGEGLSRFTNNRKAPLQKKEVKTDSRPQQAQVRVMSRSNSEPTAIQRGSTNGVQRLPVQRKTAILNKENRLKGLISPPQLIRADVKTARTVLGSYQRRNTEGAESGAELRLSKQQNTRTAGLSAQTARKPGPHNTQPNPVTKQVGVLGAEHYNSPKERSMEPAEDRTTMSEEEEGGGDKVPVHSFELSFQEKFQSWESDRQLENLELGEFELLEQAADELSFSSNSSFVMKVLQMDQHHRQLQVAQGLHQRRLSSTPIKSPARGELQRSCSSSDGLPRKSSSVNSEAFAVKERDVSVKNQRRSIEEKEEQDKHEDSASSCSGSESEDQEEVVVKASLCPSNFSFPAQSHRPYDKWSYQDEDSRRASDGTQGGDEESHGNADESTLIEDKDAQRGRVVFDDDDTWNEVDEISVQLDDDSGRDSPVSKATAASVSPPMQTLLRKVAVSKVVMLDTEMSANQEPDPPPPPLPPASQLMTKLFPSLKPKTQSPPLPPPAATSVAPAEETSQQLQSRQLRERLVELEIEIERFQKENVALAKLKQENEKNQENLRKERLEFERTKAEESAKFEEYKKEENKKLQRERKLFEKHVSAARAIPDKKEREEIQVLKQQLNSLQEELRRKESRWASSHSRQRQHIDSLSEENSSLRDEIRMLEKLRLSSWKKTPVSAEKDKETKDGPRMFPNNLSTVTKGVKFASPLDSRGSSSCSSSSPPQGGAAAAADRRSSSEIGQGVAGMKSSLRRPSGAGTPSSSSSSSLPVRRTEEQPTAGNRSQDKPPNHEQSDDCSPNRDSVSTESESREAQEAETAQEVITHPDGKIEKVLVGGDRVILFPNGTRKEVSADGLTVKVTFFNGDTKQITADQRVIYFYSEAQTTHITFPDGIEVLHFPNNQTEKHFPDGRKEITFPDQMVKNLFPDGREESVLTDGTIVQVNPDGTKEIHFNTGQREIHTADYKKREYPDGTVKTVYSDGRQETHYPTGRVRIKDKDGNVLMDKRA